MSDFFLSIYPHLRALWVVWFFLLFIGMLVWVLRPSKRAAFERAARIPLDDAPPAAPRDGAAAPRHR
jgi:cytochrome c oxidase cbb3-type subunit 4